MKLSLLCNALAFSLVLTSASYAKEYVVNADVNGSANILRKFLTSKHRLGELLFQRVSKGFVNNPVRVKLSQMLNSSSKTPSTACVSPA